MNLGHAEKTAVVAFTYALTTTVVALAYSENTTIVVVVAASYTGDGPQLSSTGSAAVVARGTRRVSPFAAHLAGRTCAFQIERS